MNRERREILAMEGGASLRDGGQGHLEKTYGIGDTRSLTDLSRATMKPKEEVERNKKEKDLKLICAGREGAVDLPYTRRNRCLAN